MSKKNRNKKHYLRRQQRMNDVPNTLSESQRELVLDTFKRKCALTNKRHDVELDHFVPVSWGKKVIEYDIGGTTYANTIPLNSSINSSKSSHNPFLWFKRYGERHGISRDKWKAAVEYIAKKHGLSSTEYENRVNACYSEVLAERWITDVNSRVNTDLNLTFVINRALRMKLNIPVVVELFGSTSTQQLFNDKETIKVMNKIKVMFNRRLMSKQHASFIDSEGIEEQTDRRELIEPLNSLLARRKMEEVKLVLRRGKDVLGTYDKLK